jgi:molybdopterin-binding protein
VAESESSRIEIGFDGGQIMSALVTEESAEELERAVSGGREATIALDAQDGRYTVVLPRVVYVKRFAREARVGFGNE